ncbi:hypothetical protein F5890DRAFT_1479346, partial [Lentinula detonsa]
KIPHVLWVFSAYWYKRDTGSRVIIQIQNLIDNRSAIFDKVHTPVSSNPKIKFSDYVKFNYTTLLTALVNSAQVQLSLGVGMMQLKEKKYGIRYAWQWVPVARQQSRFSFGAAFLIAANDLSRSPTIEVLVLPRLPHCRKRSCGLSSCFLVDIGRNSVARQQLRFSFGAAFLIAANSLANNRGSQSLANNRGSRFAPPSSLPQMFMQLDSVSPQSSNDDHE